MAVAGTALSDNAETYSEALAAVRVRRHMEEYVKAITTPVPANREPPRPIEVVVMEEKRDPPKPVKAVVVIEPSPRSRPAGVLKIAETPLPAPEKDVDGEAADGEEDGSHEGEQAEEGRPVGPPSKAIYQAYEAVNCLKRISPNDPKRVRAWEIVGDWLKHNPLLPREGKGG
jgi:hypothetical protein